MQVRRLQPADAVATYERALLIDPSLAAVWHNLASAHLKLRDTAAAATCLQRALDIDPALPSARHLLASLGVAHAGSAAHAHAAVPVAVAAVGCGSSASSSGSGSGDSTGSATSSSRAYGTLVDDIEARAARRSHARDLYDFYSVGYDDHMRKKLLYTAPRLLRAAVRSAVNATFTALPAARRAEHGGDVLRYMNASLSILDLGCGTGLCGSWMESYASEFVGVDISQRMLDMATKKGCYSKLVRSDIEDYLNSSPPTRHDLIVSGDALQYVGPLERVFKEAYRVLRPGGHFALTVPLLTADPRVIKSAAIVSDSDDAVSDGVVSDTDTTSSSSGTDGSDSSSDSSSRSEQEHLLPATPVTPAMLAEGYYLQQEGTYAYTA
eukprot:20926-Heterococcus_DN1.PRE.2